MDYRYLKAFILTAQHSSFSKAAEILGVAQSAISRQIKLLEEGLGVELIIRSSKKVILTNKGRELYIESLKFDKIASDIFQKEDKRPLRIGVLHGLLEGWLNSIIVMFYQKYSRNINIKVGAPQDLKNELSKGEFDIIFTTENIQSELISSLNILHENLVLISSKEIDASNLHNYRWIVYNTDDHLFKISAIASESVVVVNSITTIVNLVKNNVGIAIVPDHALKNSNGLNMYPLKDQKKSNIYMSSLNYKVLPNYIKEITDLIKGA